MIFEGRAHETETEYEFLTKYGSNYPSVTITRMSVQCVRVNCLEQCDYDFSFIRFHLGVVVHDRPLKIKETAMRKKEMNRKEQGKETERGNENKKK